MPRTEYGSEFDWDSNAPILRRQAGELPVADAKYYRSGRDALKALARALPASAVLLPALSYGIGYTRGVAMRTRIHTDIARNKRKARKKQKQQQKEILHPLRSNLCIFRSRYIYFCRTKFLF